MLRYLALVYVVTEQAAMVRGYPQTAFSVISKLVNGVGYGQS